MSGGNIWKVTEKLLSKFGFCFHFSKSIRWNSFCFVLKILDTQKPFKREKKLLKTVNAKSLFSNISNKFRWNHLKRWNSPDFFLEGAKKCGQLKSSPRVNIESCLIAFPFSNVFHSFLFTSIWFIWNAHAHSCWRLALSTNFLHATDNHKRWWE